MRSSLFVIILGALTACSNSSPTFEALSQKEIYLKVDELSQQRVENVQGSLPIKTSSSTSQPEESDFLAQLCELNPDYNTMIKYISPHAPNPNRIFQQIYSVSQTANCEALQVLERDGSLGLASYKIEGVFLGGEVLYDENLKVISLQLINFRAPFKIERKSVTNRQNQSLATYLVYYENPQKQKGIFFQRSPYMSYGGLLYSSLLALTQDMVYVSQANRGTHTSEGEFKWLDPVSNKNDSSDTIDWLVEQNHIKAHEGVVLFGVSYDGFNALAGGVSHHPKVKSIISCSSPANAATDSLSSGKHIEAFLFPYVTNRASPLMSEGDTLGVGLIQNGALFALPDQQAQLDTDITGKDSPEWNLITAAGSDQNHPYWTERSLYKDLETLKVPTLHVGGLKRDQDGRDTILTYDYIQNNGFNSDKNHFLFLHRGGHGCGDAFQSSIMMKLLNLAKGESVNLSGEPQVIKYSLKDHRYKVQDMHQENRQAFPLARNSFVKDLLFMPQNEGTSYEKIFDQFVVYEAKEKTYLNGTPEVNFLYISDLDEVSVHLILEVVNPRGQAVEQLMRSKFITQKGMHSVRLKMPPLSQDLKQGATVRLSVSSAPSYSFFRYPAARSFLLEKDEHDTQDVGVHILAGGNSSVELPIE